MPTLGIAFWFLFGFVCCFLERRLRTTAQHGTINSWTGCPQHTPQAKALSATQRHSAKSGVVCAEARGARSTRQTTQHSGTRHWAKRERRSWRVCPKAENVRKKTAAHRRAGAATHGTVCGRNHAGAQQRATNGCLVTPSCQPSKLPQELQSCPARDRPWQRHHKARTTPCASTVRVFRARAHNHRTEFEKRKTQIHTKHWAKLTDRRASIMCVVVGVWSAEEKGQLIGRSIRKASAQSCNFFFWV